MKKLLSSLFFILLAVSIANAQKGKQAALKKLDSNSEKYGEIAMEIWNWAEMGYQEEKSSALLQKTLADEGFSIKTGIANIPTAFVAEYGSGSPVIAVLGEYDALPGLSQQAIPEKKIGKWCRWSCLWSSFIWNCLVCSSNRGKRLANGK